MKWLNRMQNCIEYIENNLKGEIDMDALAQKAYLSRRYFVRMFDAMTDMSVSEYIRKRRMTLAARELSQGKSKLIDIALDYGYSSPEAFSRAFKSVHGISPSLVKANGSKLVSYPPISFQIKIKGEAAMNYKIEKKQALKVIGKAITTSEVDGANFREIPKFWTDTFGDGSFERMYKLCEKDTKSFGICLQPKEKGSREFDYVIGFSISEQAAASQTEFNIYDISEASWAVFECVGAMPDAIQKVWKRIFSEWLPATNYEIDMTMPEIEYYTEGDNGSEDYYCEIWIPIVGS